MAEPKSRTKDRQCVFGVFKIHVSDSGAHRATMCTILIEFEKQQRDLVFMEKVLHFLRKPHEPNSDKSRQKQRERPNGWPLHPKKSRRRNFPSAKLLLRLESTSFCFRFFFSKFFKAENRSRLVNHPELREMTTTLRARNIHCLTGEFHARISPLKWSIIQFRSLNSNRIFFRFGSFGSFNFNCKQCCPAYFGAWYVRRPYTHIRFVSAKDEIPFVACAFIACVRCVCIPYICWLFNSFERAEIALIWAQIKTHTGEGGTDGGKNVWNSDGRQFKLF